MQKKNKEDDILPDIVNAYWLFISAAVVLLIIPGPSVLFIVARSIEQGRSAGLVSVLGVHVGSFFHVIAAAVGISAVLMTSAAAFTIIKYIGAAYLIYLGFRQLFSNHKQSSHQPIKPKRLSGIFYEAIIVNTLNPKTALFFLAFLPQFIKATNGSVIIQFVILGSIYILLGLVSDSMYVILASGLRNWFAKHSFTQKIQQYITGSIYIILGVATAFVSSNKK